MFVTFIVQSTVRVSGLSGRKAENGEFQVLVVVVVVVVARATGFD